MKKEELPSNKKILWGVVGFILGLGVAVIISGIIFMLTFSTMMTGGRGLGIISLHIPPLIVGLIGVIMAFKAKKELKYIGYGLCVYTIIFYLGTSWY